MDIQNQIRYHRERLGLTQEELAQKMYVSRQTISNWETAHSYPDLENLLRLSILFDTSLDDLIKGDALKMKAALSYAHSSWWSILMTVTLGLAAFSIGPSTRYFNWWGLLIPIILVNISCFAGLKIERWKARHQLKTYSDILAFRDQQSLDDSDRKRLKTKDRITVGLTMLGFTFGAVGLALIGFWLF